jgi:lipopolysaccharide transport system ATP-binding protein
LPAPIDIQVGVSFLAYILSMSVVIEVDRLCKEYRLGEIGGKRLVDDFNRWMAKVRGKEDPLASLGPDGSSHSTRTHSSTGNGSHADTFCALKDVSFEVRQGEVLGLVGRNGAGKSTVLKILSRVTAPTRGEVRIKGRIASLLESGTGFHPELTGRENIFLNGAILGMTRAEIHGKFDEIVAFSEVEQFIDAPVKRYSSGMYVRLAFAVAAHLEPEILIVDEVLAVGDAAFQQKCLGKMKDVAGEGRTILFVSHNMEPVRRLCSRGLWLHESTVRMDDTIDRVVDAYTESMAQQPRTVLRNAKYGLTIFGIQLFNQLGVSASTFRSGDDLVVELNYEAKTPVARPMFALVIQGFKGACFAANMLLDGHQPEVLHGKGKITCTFKSIPLLPQHYHIQLAVRAKNGKDMIINYNEVASFIVSCDLEDYGYKGEYAAHAAHSTSVVVPYQWQLPDGRVANVGLSNPNV